ncbi:MAG: DNA polymerase III subunit gamma/tau [Pseudoflavonifractor sp.]|nr:DNA polymerase III subunit gamma/tau [Pseudoflavonifractor sp.]
MENYLVSARKYRPSTFKTVLGQKALTATLKNSIATDRLAHAYLFCGSRGVGKTSCARIFAKTINCEHRTPDGDACNECDSCRAFNEGRSLNIVELDAASNNGIDDVRALVDQVQVPPTHGRYRVFIIDEVHMLSTAAFNAFLKTLEEPPSYVIFILATTEKHKIIPTILSRCQIYDFNRITIQDMIDHLGYVAAQEGITVEESALNIIARKADGAMRDALSIFDQVAASSMGHITYKSTIDNLNVLDYDYYWRLIDAFLEGNVPKALLIFQEIREKGFDAQFFITGLASHFRDLMVARDPSTLHLLEASDEIRRTFAEQAQRCTPDFIYAAMNLCNRADLNYRVSSNKQFLVELTLVQLCQLLSPSPGNDGDGEGQLKKIEVTPVTSSASSPADSRPQVSATTVSEPPQATYDRQPQPSAAHATTPTPPPTPRPPVTGRKVVNLRTPNVSLKGGIAASSATTHHATPTTATKRTGAYDDKKVGKAWDDFMTAHPKEHVLVNTMRAARPVRESDDAFVITVENPAQTDLMHQWLPEILSALHDAAANDMITLRVAINEGAAPAYTWNERDVYAHMVANIPGLKSFIDDFKLTLS